MLTIEEIIKRKNAGKRKWRSSLIPYIQTHLDKNVPMEIIASFLLETFRLSITVDILYKIKRDYYKATDLFSNINDIEKQPNKMDSLLLHEKMNNLSLKKSQIELGEDF